MRIVVIIFCLFLSSILAAQQTPNITIITTDQFIFDGHEMTKYQVKEFYNVDEFVRADKELTKGLPNNEAQAAEFIKKRLPNVQEMISRGFRAGLLIKKWELNNLPAIVFNQGEAVYYGMDIGRAVDAWYDHKNRGNEG